MVASGIGIKGARKRPPHQLGRHFGRRNSKQTLNEICESLGYTPEQLVIEALRGQIDCWNEFYDYVMTWSVKPGDLVWPKDPVFCLACVTTVHIIDSFTRCSHDPVAFAQLKDHAPSEWSFSSLGEEEEIDDADWWKTHS